MSIKVVTDSEFSKLGNDASNAQLKLKPYACELLKVLAISN